jgi:hypothetical protein
MLQADHPDCMELIQTMHDCSVSATEASAIFEKWTLLPRVFDHVIFYLRFRCDTLGFFLLLGWESYKVSMMAFPLKNSVLGIVKNI